MVLSTVYCPQRCHCLSHLLLLVAITFFFFFNFLLDQRLCLQLQQWSYREVQYVWCIKTYRQNLCIPIKIINYMGEEQTVTLVQEAEAASAEQQPHNCTQATLPACIQTVSFFVGFFFLHYTWVMCWLSGGNTANISGFLLLKLKRGWPTKCKNLLTSNWYLAFFPYRMKIFYWSVFSGLWNVNLIASPNLPLYKYLWWWWITGASGCAGSFLCHRARN